MTKIQSIAYVYEQDIVEKFDSYKWAS